MINAIISKRNPVLKLVNGAFMGSGGRMATEVNGYILTPTCPPGAAQRLRTTP